MSFKGMPDWSAPLKTAGGDGHVLQGTFRFVVRAPPAAAFRS